MLPPLYGRWMTELLGGPIATESRATCDDCAMLPEKGAERQFDKKTKCCTYYPELPNYSVGALIGDPTASGRRELKNRFDRIVGMTPLGMARLPVYQALLAKLDNATAFGQAVSMQCGFQDEQGRCGVWAYREATCFHYHCKFDRGSRGAALWKALKELFVPIEKQLAMWCLVELDPGDVALEMLTMPAPVSPRLGHHELDGTVDKAHMKLAWGTWLGREAQFYSECWKRVKALSWTDVLAICGPDVRVRARAVVAAYKAHESTQLPEALAIGSFQSKPVGKKTRLRTFSPTDVIDLDPSVVAALAEFDGRPTAEVLEVLATRGVSLDDGELRRLVDFEVLIPAARLTKGA